MIVLFYNLHLQREAQLGLPGGWIPSTDNMGFAAGALSFPCSIAHLVRVTKTHP
jgi:hypothetical protein